MSSDKSFYYGSFQKGEPDGAGVMHRAITDPKHKYFGGFELINGIWKFGKITDTNPDVETCTANKCQMIQSSIRFFKDEINSIFKTCSGRMISASELQGVCHYVDNNFIYIGNFISDNVRGEYVLIEFDELNSDYVKIQHGFFNHSGNETVYSRERVK
ncbi:hypothetical protein EHQ61_00830 [Leptospira wolffii]|nr:hypothetical protein [Leptospira wolffii]TGL55287.1 hypothetical protein EHQ61_00830 [Leptospira wolffii]